MLRFCGSLMLILLVIFGMPTGIEVASIFTCITTERAGLTSLTVFKDPST